MHMCKALSLFTELQTITPPQPRSRAQLSASGWPVCTVWVQGPQRHGLSAAPPTGLSAAPPPGSAPRCRGLWSILCGPPGSAPGPGYWAGGGRLGCSRSPTPTTRGPGPGLPLLQPWRLLRPHRGGGRGALRRRVGPTVLVTSARAPLRHLVGLWAQSFILSCNKGSLMLK